MGDIADMMLDGTLCECCGVFIDNNDADVPRKCAHCARETKPQTQRKANHGTHNRTGSSNKTHRR